MLTATTHLPEMFRYVTADVKTRLGISVLHYEHGHPREIIDTLLSMTKSHTQTANKFPLIALYQDYPEERGGNTRFYKVKLQLIICMLSRPNYTAAVRLEKTFKPVLYPIYEMLLQSVAKSGYFREHAANLVKHTKTDRVFWGKSGLYGTEGLIMNDYIDAIELTDFELSPEIKCTTNDSNIK
jgi:hypothetical protein